MGSRGNKTLSLIIDSDSQQSIVIKTENSDSTSNNEVVENDDVGNEGRYIPIVQTII